MPKVIGAARYLDDLRVPGAWHGATLRSPHAHARIASLRWAADRAPTGAVAVRAADIPGPNGIALLDDSWPVLADEVACHIGEPIALVAAPTRLDARRALDAFEVAYEPLEPILSVEAALQHPPLYELSLNEGDVDAALRRAELVVEGRYQTGYQEHIYIECQGAVAWFEPDGTVVVLGSMQCPYYVHKALCHTFGLPKEKVRVRAPAVGGGFGGKEDYPSMIAVHAALLARACGRPVKIVYDRHEDIIGTTKRHPSIVWHRTAVSRDGHLAAMDIDIVMDGGAYKTLSPVVLSRGLLHATGPYRCPHVRIRARAVRTNTATNGAFRGFGAPQTQFAVERHMDRIAGAVGLDPFEIRARNVVRPGDRLPTGQTLGDSTFARQCLEAVEVRTRFRSRWREIEERRASGDPLQTRDEGPLAGIGLSLYFHGAGFTGNGERMMRSPVTARLLRDGRIEVLTAMTDMGQGCAAVFPQIAAEAAGVRLEDVVIAEPDTGRVPDSGPTVASRTTMIVGGTIAQVTREIRARVEAWAGGVVTPDDFRATARRYVQEVGPLEVTRRHEPDESQTFDEETYHGAAYPTYAWGADVIEVEVDPDTLQARPTRATVVCEVGRAIHPTLCKGQIEGGTLQAIGWATIEELKMADGRYLNDRLATYIIPTFKDSPRIDVELLEQPWEGGPFGAKGVGELPMDGGAPAVAQAIENATGIRVTEIPATPERLLARKQAGG